MYAISEIFYSLQGEGYWAGTPVVFVRFAGCNLKCHFCDTDFRKNADLSAEQILDEVSAFPANRVVFTGGEPMLQLDRTLIQILQRSGFIVHVETNGTINKPELMRIIDWVTVSPKVGQPFNLKSGHEVKVVFEGQDLKPYVDMEKTRFTHHFLQPMSMKNTEEVVEQCLKNPRWRLSLQLQKYLKLR